MRFPLMILTLLSLALTIHVSLPVKAMAKDGNSTLYDDLGGKPVMDRVISDMLKLALADSKMAPIFANSDLDRLERLLILHTCHIADGPCVYEGQDMRRAHDGLGIRPMHFYRLVEDLQQAMDAQDIRTLAQQRLADSVENSEDAVLLTDVDGKIIVANPGVKSLFPTLLNQRPSQDLLGVACGTLFAVDGIPLHIAQSGPACGNEFQISGDRRVRVNAAVTREGGRLFIWSDITESKMQSERLRLARDAAEAASRAKTLFLAAMSHEMNTPLNVVIGLSDVLRSQQNGPNGDTQTANMLGLISQSGDHMAKIVRDLLDIASDDDAVLDIAQLAAIDPADPITRAVQSLKGLAQTNDVRLIWSRPDAPAYIAADTEDAELLAHKLIDNAIKFNRPGGAVKVQAKRVISNLQKRAITKSAARSTRKCGSP